ncbi:1,4-alpha-glucan branching protein GlgB [Xanthomonas sp. XNM01]|uniref:1,4-alpha-glucan branching protein GlgB n=1 Tax=Xanthomonas sp. XNM01 TaxID=2769289 RepID=UPI00177D246C|nr:1,4-alpha-glucan branching protein GlgB [Xanthomonas sp. XNM01]MBD9368418.1 1,4-alpha-glucan branching protein GlgB [Xanthomonas sp. XNM01]
MTEGAVVLPHDGDTGPPAGQVSDTGSDAALQALADGQPGDAFAWLGPHRGLDGRWRLRVLLPDAHAVRWRASVDRAWQPMRPAGAPGVFEAEVDGAGAHQLRIDRNGAVEEVEDAYGFGPVLDAATLHAIAAGDGEACRHALGAHRCRVEGVDGVRFAVWAPNARRVAVVGDFNGWDGRRHPMRLRHDAGVWELFLPRLHAGALYKFEITAADGSRQPHKADPYARQCEHPPSTASRVADDTPFAWHDAAWIAQRATQEARPLSIYEVHAGSWRRHPDGRSLDWDELADQLIPHVAALGFTHIELLPISEYPFGGSWGYQPLGIYAPTARHGSPEAFARFVDRCHQAGIGVILDWVSAHFPTDAHGLLRFDGTALYEHEDPREGFHRDWHTAIYNYGRNEVAGFLIGSALEWIERFHIDGLRVDAVASMLYRDYSRAEGEWIPNEHGGRENLQAIAFLRRMNGQIRQRFPDVMLIAEESTAWPGVTAPVEEGGLGFTHKWNMGWMHDTLQHMQRDPVHRGFHHSEMTFGLVYAFAEQFVLPLSHDEVVHGKRSLLGKMPGDEWQRFANLRAYLALMWAHPGSKLLFMGGEFGQSGEWNHDAALDWEQARQPRNDGLARLVGDLNRMLRAQPALHRGERDERSFDWSVADDAHNSVLAFLRHDPTGATPSLLAVTNLTPLPRHGYRVGVPLAGRWRELLNTDSRHYGGSDIGNAGILLTQAQPMHGHAQSLALTLPPLATLYLQIDP